MPTLNEFLEKALDGVNLTEGKINWKNDPWGARDELVEKGQKLLKNIQENINPSESLFFYDKNQKHINGIGKAITALDKSISQLEVISKKI